jgi:uncharacterized Zn finger protein
VLAGAVKNSNVFDWHKRFKDGSENVEGDERSSRGRHYTTDKNVEKLRHLVH